MKVVFWYQNTAIVLFLAIWGCGKKVRERGAGLEGAPDVARYQYRPFDFRSSFFVHHICVHRESSVAKILRGFAHRGY